jgi:hypothetical protein
MVARFILVCDVCGAITDDHYPYPVARARRRARALGFTYRRVATTPGDYRGSHASYHRFWVDLCGECTYTYDGRAPIHGAPWTKRRGKFNTDGDAEPMHPVEPTPSIRYDDVVVVYVGGQGPYRLYTALVRQLREKGISRSQLERLRREMFANGADFLDVAGRWVTIEQQETDSETEEGVCD